jgi:hypothetical protein
MLKMRSDDTKERGYSLCPSSAVVKIDLYCNLVMCWISNILGVGVYLQLLIALLAIPLSVPFPNNLHLEVFLYIKAV